MGSRVPVQHCNLRSAGSFISTNSLHDLNTVDSRPSNIDSISADADHTLNADEDSDAVDCIHDSYSNSLPLHSVGVEEDHTSLENTGSSGGAYDLLSIEDVSPIESARARFLQIIVDHFISDHVIKVVDNESEYAVHPGQDKLTKRKSGDVQYEGDPMFALPLMYVANMYETLVNDVNTRLASLNGVRDKTIGVALEAAGGLYRRMAKKFPKKGSCIFKRRELATSIETRTRFPELVIQEEKRVRFVVVNGLGIVEKPSSMPIVDAEWPGAGVDFDIVYEPRYSFGFNSSTGDYKVLNICSITGYKLQVNPINGLSTREVSRKTVEFEIFTIGCDRGAGSWRKIDPGYPYDQELYSLTSESVCADGVIHWRHRLLDQEILLAFDLQQEKFQIIQVPKEALGFQLMKQVKGCLVLMGHVTSGYNRNKIDLWILEDRFDQVWMKETVLFPSYSPCLWPVGSFKTGLILLAQHGCANPAAWAAYYCDLETKNICMIHVPELKSVKLPCGEVGKPSDVVLTVHAENLLSLTSNAYEHPGKKG